MESWTKKTWQVVPQQREALPPLRQRLRLRQRPIGTPASPSLRRQSVWLNRRKPRPTLVPTVVSTVHLSTA
jgi:hypothetical protein